MQFKRLITILLTACMILTLAPAAGYSFEYWYDSDTGGVLSTANL